MKGLKFNDLTDIPIIDAHVHVFPDRLAMAVRQWFAAHAWEFVPRGRTDDLLRDLFAAGAAGLVLMPYAHRPGMAEGLNNFTADLVKKFDRTRGLAAIHPHDQNQRDLVDRAINQLGLCGVKLHCHVQKTAPDDPVLFPLYEALIEFNGILNIHAGREPASEAYGINVHEISGTARLANVLDRYPELTIIVPHLCWDEPDELFSLMDGYPNLFTDTAMILADFFPVNLDREKLIKYADRILYGTDYPHIPYPVETEIQALLSLNLGESASRKIFHENAAMLFNLKSME